MKHKFPLIELLNYDKKSADQDQYPRIKISADQDNIRDLCEYGFLSADIILIFVNTGIGAPSCTFKLLISRFVAIKNT